MTVETPITANGTRKDGFSNAGVYSLKQQSVAQTYPTRHLEARHMETPDYLQEEMKFAQRELPAAPGAAPRTIEATTPSKLIGAPFDLFEGVDRLPGGFEGSGQEFEMNRSAKEVAARRLTADARMDRFEESAYWLLSAATLVYLLLGIISW